MCGRRHVARKLAFCTASLAIATYGALLPESAAFVHRGGIGCTRQALRDNATRASHLGGANEVLPKHYSGRFVATALKKLAFDASLRLWCRAVATRLANCNFISTARDTILDRPGEMMPHSSTKTDRDTAGHLGCYTP